MRFGGLTPAQIDLILEGSARRDVAQARRRRGEIYALAALVTRGHHDPKKFPKPEAFLGPDTRKKRGGSEAEFAAYMRARIAMQKPKQRMD